MPSQKPFKMISLREIDLQPSWNDILAKNLGGWGYVPFSNHPILAPQPHDRLARKFMDLKLRIADMDAQGIAMQAISLTAPTVRAAAQDSAGWHGGANSEAMTAAAEVTIVCSGV